MPVRSNEVSENLKHMWLGSPTVCVPLAYSTISCKINVMKAPPCAENAA